jgi:hypothetical protein
MPIENGRKATNVSNVLSVYLDRNQRQLDMQWLGKFVALVTEGAVSSGSPQAVTAGIGKLFIVVNAGSDVDGTLTVTGTKVDRNTGAETGSFTEDIVIDTLTTDDSDTDAEGNIRYAFTDAYITANWYSGSAQLSSDDLTLTDIDVYGVAFEQFNDVNDTTLTTLDLTATPTNTAAWLYLYLYKLAPDASTKKCAVTREISLSVAVGVSEANVPYRLRRGKQAVHINGVREGVVLNCFFGPDAQIYWNDIDLKLWFNQ